MGMWTLPQDDPVQDGVSAEELDEFIETFARQVIKRGMAVPAVMTLEMAKPLSFIGYSALSAFSPLLEAIVDPKKMARMRAVLACRKNVDRLIERIEQIGSETDKPKEGD